MPDRREQGKIKHKTIELTKIEYVSFFHELDTKNDIYKKANNNGGGWTHSELSIGINSLKSMSSYFELFNNPKELIMELQYDFF